MADAAAARREARRRKILENSGNRLQKITGKADESLIVSPCSSNTARSFRPIPESEYMIPVSTTNSSSFKTSQPNGLLHTEPEPIPFLTSYAPSFEIDASGSGDGELTSDLASLLHPTLASETTIQKPAVPLWEKLTANKYDLVLLSLFIQILNGMSLITFDTGGYFFSPVIVYILSKLVWFPQQNTSNIANVLLLLNGMTPSKVRKIVFLTQSISVVTCDTFVYLFTTICIQSLYITLHDSMVT